MLKFQVHNQSAARQVYIVTKACSRMSFSNSGMNQFECRGRIFSIILKYRTIFYRTCKDKNCWDSELHFDCKCSILNCSRTRDIIHFSIPFKKLTKCSLAARYRTSTICSSRVWRKKIKKKSHSKSDQNMGSSQLMLSRNRGFYRLNGHFYPDYLYLFP